MDRRILEKLEGCFYTIFTPFDKFGQIDFETLEKYIEKLYAGGAQIFYVMAYNSRYSQLSNEEIFTLNEFCCRTVKSLSPDNVIIVGDPIHCDTKTSIEYSRHARDCGADLISLLFREKFFCEDQVLDHFAEVGSKSKMAIMVHEMPFLSGYDGTQMHWPKTLLSSLPKIPHIVALKEDAKVAEITIAALSLEPSIRVVIAGSKSSLLKYREYGVRAYLNGISMIDARIGELFWKAFSDGDDKMAAFIVDKLERPFVDNCVNKFGWHRVNKAFLDAAGIMSRRDRMPLRHLADADFEEVLDCYNEVKANWEAFLSK
jgi:4-hydroxy-tetrahydrodipicolinate synthase